jgi:hypothetical protein
VTPYRSNAKNAADVQIYRRKTWRRVWTSVYRFASGPRSHKGGVRISYNPIAIFFRLVFIVITFPSGVVYFPRNGSSGYD